MISVETMRCCKVRRILRYHAPNNLLSSENFAYHAFALVFFSLREEKKINIMLSAIASKQTARARSAGCCKYEQNKV